MLHALGILLILNIVSNSEIVKLYRYLKLNESNKTEMDSGS